MALTDDQIMLLVQGGRREPFEELVRRYRAPLLRAAESKLGNAAWAEDVVQETFLAVFAARDTYNPSFAFRTWLWTILLNLCRRHLKRRGRRSEELSPNGTSPVPGGPSILDGAHHETGLTRVLQAERNARLRAMLQTLPDVQADALRLRFFGGLKFHEIAEAMGCSLNGAKMRVKKGLLSLAESLRDEEGDER